MSWLDNLLGRRPPSIEGSERQEDDEALEDLRRAGKRVNSRTDRIVAAYTEANRQRLAQKKP